MNYLRVLLGLGVAACLSSATLTAQNTPTTPTGNGGKLEVVGGDTYNWGSVPPGALKATIEVKNIGEGTLNISGVVPSCGCTTTGIDKNVLAPGEVGKINVSVDVSNREGNIEKTMTINSDDASNKARVIRLQAYIKKDYSVTPASYIMINDGKVGVETMQTLHIVNKSGSPLTLSAPKLENANVKVRFEHKDKLTVPDSGDVPLVYYVTPLGNKPNPDGTVDYTVSGSIKYTTTSKTMPELEIKIYGSTAPPASSIAPTPQGTVVSPSPTKPAQANPTISH